MIMIKVMILSNDKKKHYGTADKYSSEQQLCNSDVIIFVA